MVEAGKRITVEVYGERAVMHCPSCFWSAKTHVPPTLDNTTAVCKKCGHKWSVSFARIVDNRRRSFRKPCDLDGQLTIGKMIVQIRITEVSVTGISFMCDKIRHVALDTKCMIAFVLPNKHKTEVSTESIIRKKTHDLYGAEFLSILPYSDMAKKIHFWIQLP